MMSLAWTAEMSTGVERFDDDHRRLVGLCNELNNACRSCPPVPVLVDILDKLLSFTCEHFRREEEVMRATGYPGVEEHEAEHDQLITELSDARHRLLDGTKKGIDCEMLTFLDQWLVLHTVHMDRAYGPHLLEHGVR